MTTVFNAANEVAVSRFLAGDIEFLDIERIIEDVLSKHHPILQPELGGIEEMDAWAREAAGRWTGRV
jgi:1-deoxy-D-xylulose-5-phosphate reductoisomerase